MPPAAPLMVTNTRRAMSTRGPCTVPRRRRARLRTIDVEPGGNARVQHRATVLPRRAAAPEDDGAEREHERGQRDRACYRRGDRPGWESTPPHPTPRAPLRRRRCRRAPVGRRGNCTVGESQIECSSATVKAPGGSSCSESGDEATTPNGSRSPHSQSWSASRRRRSGMTLAAAPDRTGTLPDVAFGDLKKVVSAEHRAAHDLAEH
jgi:hypothetical protein